MKAFGASDSTVTPGFKPASSEPWLLTDKRDLGVAWPDSVLVVMGLCTALE
jgi:hypothetical protein